MSLNQVIKKIKIKGLDTTGVYLKDKEDLFNKKEIGKTDLKKLDNNPITIVLKFWHRGKTTKRTLRYSGISGLLAVKKAITKRIELREELEETGTLKRKKFKSVSELWDDYMQQKETSVSPHYANVQRVTFDKWIRPAIGDMAVDKIHTNDLQDIVNGMLRQGKKPRTAQSIKQISRPLFNYAIDMDLIKVNPALKITLPSFDNTQNFQLTDKQREDLYQQMRNYEIMKYRGIMLFLYFGRRLNEVLTLKKENIFIDHNIYVIEDQYSKSRRRLEFPLLEPLKEFLLDYESTGAGYLFPGEKKPHITADTFRPHWKKVINRAGIEKMRIHDTRHLLGNTMVNRGASLEAIGKVLGHSSSAVTKRYAKTSLQTADKLLNDYLNNGEDDE